MEFNEIVVKESPGLCRCCLSEGCYKDLGSEYTWMNEAEVYADMLLECFDISITQHNEGPNGPSRLICEVCITRLRDACNFKKQVLDSEKKFIDMLGRGEFRPKVLIYQTQMKTENSDEQVQEEVEYLEDDLDFDDDEVLKPSVDEHSSSPLETVTSETISLKRKLKTKKTKISRPKKHVEVDEKPKSSKAVSKDEESTSAIGGYTSELRRENLKLLFNNTTVMPFKWRGKYLCFFCGNSCVDYADFKNHTKSHGHCTTKDSSLRNIKDYNIDIQIDVSEIVCKICTEPFNHFDEIIDHLIWKHKINYDRSIDMSYEAYRLVDFKCLYCEEQFDEFNYLVNHVNTNHPQNRFICNDCGLCLNKKRDLASHLKIYHREGGYSCDHCVQKFDNYYKLKRHKYNTHSKHSNYLLKKKTYSRGELTCKICSKECKSLQGLSQHKNTCTADKTPIKKKDPSDLPKRNKNPQLLRIRQNIQCIINMSTATPFKFFWNYTCFYCSTKFIEFDDLREHTASEHPVFETKAKYIRKYNLKRACVKIDIAHLDCKLCCLSFSDLDDFIDHAVKDHKADYDKSVTNCLQPFRIVKDNIPCPFCPDKIFRYFNTLQRHFNSEHSDYHIMCDFCGKKFESAANLQIHSSYAHTGWCKCDICGGKFKNQSCLARHKASSHNVKDYKCEICSEVFISRYQLQKHMIQVHDIGHKCNECGKMFTRNSFMKDHIRRTHLKEKDIVCSACDERFFDKYHLKLHMVRHNGERKFTCEICGKSFLRKRNLTVHMEMHKKNGQV